jgi:Pterin 4 alpha carbinolamine dehydratase
MNEVQEVTLTPRDERKEKRERRRLKARQAQSKKLRPPRIGEKLKAERVQDLLKALPGWRLRADKRSIARTRKFADAVSMASYGFHAMHLARTQKVLVSFATLGDQLTVTLHGTSQSGRKLADLSEAVFHLAEQLG